MLNNQPLLNYGRLFLLFAEVILNTFSIIAIPFFTLAVVLLTLGATRKNRACFIVGGVLMSSAVVNAVIGMSL
ncbi:hypothetical protein CD006_01490 [Enterobacter sp. 10-1]|nr:hypothetical protein CD006_01490 [Enterobacter sp. 10-1]